MRYLVVKCGTTFIILYLALCKAARPAPKKERIEILVLEQGSSCPISLALNKHRALTKCAKLCYKKPITHENICRPGRKFLNLINVGPLIDAATSSGILKAKQKLGVTFNSDKLGGIDFTKFQN